MSGIHHSLSWLTCSMFMRYPLISFHQPPLPFFVVKLCVFLKEWYYRVSLLCKRWQFIQNPDFSLIGLVSGQSIVLKVYVSVFGQVYNIVLHFFFLLGYFFWVSSFHGHRDREISSRYLVYFLASRSLSPSIKINVPFGGIRFNYTYLLINWQ